MNKISALNGSVFITGTSRGIGHALAETLIASNYFVYGISRSNNIKHKNFFHILCDLSDISQLLNFNFSQYEIPIKEEVWLINNAGTLGELNILHNLNPKTIIEVLTVNLTAPAVLSSLFIRQFINISSFVGIIFIGSGAAYQPISGASIYCSSKSGLKMIAEAINQEMKNYKNLRVFYILPGIVETKMQEQIRATPKEKFPDVDKFIKHYKEGKNKTTYEVAHKILDLMEKKDNFPDWLIQLD